MVPTRVSENDLPNRLLASVALLWLLLAATADAQVNVKLSGPYLAHTQPTDVMEYELSPCGCWVVYRADQDTDDVFELYSAPSDGSAPPVRLDDGFVSGGDVDAFRISPDSTRIVYRADAVVDERYRLYSVAIDGSASPVEVSGAVVGNGDVGAFEFSPCSCWIVYTCDALVNDRIELFSVPSDGSAAPLVISAPPTPSRDVLDFQISPDSTRVVYRSALGPRELYSTPIDGSAAAVQINGPLGGFGHVGDAANPLPAYGITPDSTCVLYLASPDDPIRFELFRVPMLGGAAVKLNVPLSGDDDVVEFRITPDGSRVVYRRHALANQRLYAVPTDGSAAAAELDAGSALQIPFFEVTEDSGTVVFLADSVRPSVFELSAVPADDSANRTMLSQVSPLGFGDVVACHITPLGCVVYSADEAGDGVVHLYSVAIDAGAQRNLLTEPQDGGDVAAFEVDDAGEHVLYLRDQETAGIHELYTVPVDGSSTRVRLNEPLAPCGGVVSAGRITPNGAFAVYRSDPERVGVFELFTVPIDQSAAPARLNAELYGGGPAGVVRYYRLSPDGSRVVYDADQQQAGRFELFSVPIDRSSAPVQLSSFANPCGALGYLAFEISPDGTRVVYVAEQDTQGIFELYSVPILGGQSPARLNDALVAGGDVWEGLGPSFRISPDGARVVYVADQLVDERWELYSAPSDGSAPPVKLNGALSAGGDVLDSTGQPDFELTPDGSRVVYAADQDFNSRFQLYSVPSDGSSAPIRIDGPSLAASDVYQFEIADDTWVLFAADRETDETLELYAARIDGSAAPHKLSVPLTSGGDVNAFFRLTPDRTRVLYVADALVDGRHELYSVLVDGSFASVRLNPTPVAGGSVGTNAVISPNGVWALYRADQDADDVNEVYLVPCDGSAAAVKLNGALTLGGDVSAQALDDTHCVYVAEQETDNVRELYSVPLDRSRAPVKLNRALPSGGEVQSSFLIAPSGRWVVYLADQEVDEQKELYRIAIDGSRGPVKLNRPLVTGGTATTFPDFRIAPQNGRVVYVAQQDGEGSNQLYSTATGVPLSGRPVRPDATPTGTATRGR